MKKKISIAILIIMCLLVIVPFLISVLYILPAKDDFSNAVSHYKKMQESGVLRAAFDEMKEVYFGTQGTWFGILSYVLLSPFTNGEMKGIQICAFITIICYFGVIYILSRSLCKLFIDKGDFTVSHLILFFSLCFGMSSFSSPDETFFWTTGIFVYTVPFIVGIAGITFLLQYVQSDRKICLGLASVLLVCSCGGTLQLSAFFTFITMTIAIVYFLNERRIAWTKTIPFCCCFASSIINAAAPGNFVRSENYSETGIHIGSALINTGYRTIYELLRLLIHSYLLVIVIAIAMLIYYSDFQIKKKDFHPVILIIAAFVGLFITNFPVFLGYSTSEMPGIRIAFMMDAHISLFSILLTIYAVCWYKERRNIEQSRIPLKRSLLIAVILFCIWQLAWQGKASIMTTSPARAIQELTTGKMQTCHNEWIEILEEIENSQVEDVVIVRQELPESHITKDCGLKIDKETWVNGAIATYFDKKSIKIVSN